MADSFYVHLDDNGKIAYFQYIDPVNATSLDLPVNMTDQPSFDPATQQCQQISWIINPGVDIQPVWQVTDSNAIAADALLDQNTRFEDFTQTTFPVGLIGSLVSFAANISGRGASIGTTSAGPPMSGAVGSVWLKTGIFPNGQANLFNYTTITPVGSVWGFDISIRFATQVQSTLIDTYRAILGFADVSTIPNNVLAVEVGAVANNNLRIAIGDYADPTYFDTGILMGTFEPHIVRLVLDTSWNNLNIYIDNVLNQTITTSLPSTGTFIPYMGILKTGGTNSAALAVDYWKECFTSNR